MNVKISIIMPVYNGEKYLAESIKAVLSQTLSETELIIVDDGSTDSSGKIADKFALSDSRVRVIHQKNSGVSASRNAALDIASGKYIGFVDADDLPYPDMYEKLYAAAEKHGADVVSARYNSVSANNDKIVYTSPLLFPDDAPIHSDEIKKAALTMNETRCFLYIWRDIFSRELIEKNNIRFNTKIAIGEDTLFSMSCCLSAESVIGVDEPLYRYRRSEGSAMRKKYKPALTSSLILQYDEKVRLCEKIMPDKSAEFKKNSGEFFFSTLWCNLFSNLSAKEASDEKKQLRDISRSRLMRDAFKYSGKAARLYSKSMDSVVLLLMKYRLVFMSAAIIKILRNR